MADGSMASSHESEETSLPSLPYLLL